MLVRQIERIRRSKYGAGLIVATSDQPSDLPIVSLCDELEVPCFRGALDDVLDRFYKAASKFPSEHVVRLTADCPLMDPALMDEVIAFHLRGDYDYSSNALDPTFPDGLDVEVVKFEILARAWKEASLRSEREHVTAYIHQRPDTFKLGSFKNDTNLAHLRWTVDEELDFDLVRSIYEALYPQNPAFSTTDILLFLEQCPQLKTVNSGFLRNEGYSFSKNNDHPCKTTKSN